MSNDIAADELIDEAPEGAARLAATVSGKRGRAKRPQARSRLKTRPPTQRAPFPTLRLQRSSKGSPACGGIPKTAIS